MTLSPAERDALAQDLARLRSNANVTKAAVARKAGLSRMMIQHMERGHYGMTARALRAYAALCALDTDKLLLRGGFCPDDVFERLRANPALCGVVRRYEIV